MPVIRVVDQYNFPLLLRELGRAIRGGDTNIAAVVDRANTFVTCVSLLPPSDRLAIMDDGAIVRLFERVVDESRRLERIMSQREER